MGRRDSGWIFDLTFGLVVGTGTGNARSYGARPNLELIGDVTWKSRRTVNLFAVTTGNRFGFSFCSASAPKDGVSFTLFLCIPPSHMSQSQPLISVSLADLLPTQMTVGAAEVAAKRAQWVGLKRKERARLLTSHCFPAVKGPEGRYYITDHHHLGLALHEEKVDTVWVMPLADLSDTKGDTFWRVMEFRRWAHPYDEKGQRAGYTAIPKSISKLRDDPYRSLAGFVRQAGGYAKDAAPFSEFLWADFFRPLVSRKQLQATGTSALPAELLQHAVALARSRAAHYLPGWTGTSSSLAAVVTPGSSKHDTTAP